MLHEVQMINDKITHKMKDGLLKLYELNPKKSKILSKTMSIYPFTYRNCSRWCIS